MNALKNLGRFLLCVGTPALFCYLIAGFSSLEWNVFKWEAFARFILCVTSLLIGGGIFMETYED